jgi:hypothetical protein
MVEQHVAVQLYLFLSMVRLFAEKILHSQLLVRSIAVQLYFLLAMVWL